MKVAVTAQGQELSSTMDLRFGRAKWIHVVDTETGAHQVHDNTVHLNLSHVTGQPCNQSSCPTCGSPLTRG